ncbi:MAG: endonuclease [Xanthomonadales bacterium]|nr:endonuclease [Xanthomonadales bacterium]
MSQILRRSPLLLAGLACLAAGAALADSTVFVNELHYDNTGTDVGERIEVVGPAGTSMAGWSLVLYNGSNGQPYDTLPLTGVLPDHCGGYGTAVVAPSQIQNGDPDGLALVDNGTVVQFLSYEGSFTANGGPANGMTSVDIGVYESSSTPIGHSLQLTGSGSTYSDFTWQPPADDSFGACNPGQSFGPVVDLPPTLVSLDPTDGASGVSTLPTLTATFSEPVTLAPGAIALACSASGNVSLTVSASTPAIHIATPTTPLQNLETCTVTVTGALVTDLDGDIDEMVEDHIASFITQPDLPPTVASHVPAAGGSGVSPQANLSIDFSEPVSTQPGWLQLHCDDSGMVEVAISGGPMQYVADPDVDLVALESCTATVLAAHVIDLDGTPTPMAADYSWTFTIASDNGDYYASVITDSAVVLRQTLHAVIRDHQSYPYTSSQTDTWDILELADQDPSNPNRILDVFRNETYVKVNGGNSNYNREHTWPNSLGFPNSSSSAYTDTHMLMLSHIGYNSDRGNKYFGHCTSGCTGRATVANNGQGGSGDRDDSNWFNGSVWETWIGRRGDVARAVMYMDIRYEGGSHSVTGQSEPDLILTDNASLIGTGRPYMGLLNVILEWHEQDPPDDQERLRNEVIYSFQGNRNPFIDHPEWAACLFQDICTVTPPADRIFADGFE